MATNLLGLIDYVNQQGDAGRQLGQQNRFAQLAGQAYNANPEQRNALVGQAVGVNPQAGMALGNQLQANDDSEMKKVAGAAKYVLDAYKSGNAAQVQGAYRATIPLLTRMGAAQGKVPPPEFSEDMLPGLYQVIAAAGGDNVTGMPTGFREFEMTAKAAGLQPGTPEYQQAARIALGSEGRASSAGIGFQKVTGADGRERIGRSNPRTGAFEVYNEQSGQFEPMGGPSTGAAAPAMGQAITPQSPAMPDAAQRANAYLSQGMTPQQAAMRVNADGGGVQRIQLAIDPTTGQFRDVSDGSAQQSANPGLGVSRSPEETAAATEAAKQRVGLEYLPQTEAIKTQAAIQQKQGEAQIKNTADMSALNATRQRDAQNTLTLLDEAAKLLPNATGSSAGTLLDKTAAGVGYSTPGAQATASLETIAGQLTSKMPRMQGPQSDKDVLLYKQMAGDLANSTLPVATRQAALATIRLLNEKYAGNQKSADRVLHYNPATGRIE